MKVMYIRDQLQELNPLHIVIDAWTMWNVSEGSRGQTVVQPNTAPCG